MLFMVIETFRNQNGKAVYRKLRDAGRGLPEGLTFVASYVTADLDRCFQLMETDDITLFQRWIADWQDVVEFEVVPVVEGKTTREALTPLLLRGRPSAETARRGPSEGGTRGSLGASFHAGRPQRAAARSRLPDIEVACVELGDVHEPSLVHHPDAMAVSDKGAELPQVLNRAVHVHYGKPGCIGEVDLGQRDEVASDTYGFKAADLLADQAGNSLQGRALSSVQNPFLEDSRLQCGRAFEGQADLRALCDDAVDILMRNHANEAVGYRSNRIVQLRQGVTAMVAKVAGVVKREDLAAAAFQVSVATGDARQHDCQNVLRLPQRYDVVTAVDAARAREK